MKATFVLLTFFISNVLLAQDIFKGTIVYSTQASGEPEAAKMFNEYQAREIRSSWSNEGFEQSEETGMNAGRVFWKYGDKTATYIQKSNGEILEAAVQSMSDMDESVKAFMPQFFEYELEDLGEDVTIAGYRTQKYLITKSGFVKSNAKAFVWIASDLQLKPTQLKFETEWKVILSAMPLQFGFTEGAVLKAEISEPSMFGEGDVKVVYEVKEVNAGVLPEGFMQKP